MSGKKNWYRANVPDDLRISIYVSVHKAPDLHAHLANQPFGGGATEAKRLMEIGLRAERAGGVVASPVVPAPKSVRMPPVEAAPSAVAVMPAAAESPVSRNEEGGRKLTRADLAAIEAMELLGG